MPEESKRKLKKATLKQAYSEDQLQSDNNPWTKTALKRLVGYGKLMANGIDKVDLETLLGLSIELDQIRNKIVSDIGDRMERIEQILPFEEVKSSHKNSLLSKGVTSQLSSKYG